MRASIGSVLTAQSPAERSAPPVLELCAISKRYGAVHALSEVSLNVIAGEIVGLLGENGAGKSTLVKIAAGIARPDSGEIRVAGSPTVFAGPAAAHAAGIRIAPQELILCKELSVAENISMGQLPTRGLHIVNLRIMRAHAQERLASIGAGHIDVQRLVGQLSVVDQTFVQFARALTPGTRVLIADEPTAPMSGDEVNRILDVITEITRTGIGIIYVSHRLEEVFRIVDRSVILRDGRKVAELTGDQMTRDGIVEAMIGSRSLELSGATRQRSDDVLLSIHALAAGRLRRFDAEINAGEVVAVYGVAGSGRDDLGGAIVGAIRRRSGRVTVAGRDLPRDNVRASIAAGIGYVPAERRTLGLVLQLSVRENITLAILRRLTRAIFLKKREERNVAERWLRDLQITAPSVEAPVWTLSGGSQQKVLLARWLAAESRVLVLEEPTRGVDIATKAEIYRILGNLADRGTAVIVISSDLEEIVTLGERVIVVRDGVSTTDLRRATGRQVAAAALAAPEED